MIEKREIISKKEIVGNYNIIQVQIKVDFVEVDGGNEEILSTQIKHETYSPDMDLSIVPTELHDLANLLWTDEVKASWEQDHAIDEETTSSNNNEEPVV